LWSPRPWHRITTSCSHADIIADITISMTVHHYPDVHVNQCKLLS
jgi:hypothetical protein